ncbi:hypothetical protein CROQUDRAFT_672090 [Cronartium quercuum f. sp. fusiforme G11]|uniref:Tetraspanin n=1 Tax=Cronartium quercuum f. sp. fusiforme G11 TaxID=708437 RepID=A0A9P6NIP8_9BASI|nr:hypothetical protein CROQUDRAFT_672090 [Cronartium quercuum f. sp. fusiforme G11]
MKLDSLTRYTYIFIFLDILLFAAAVFTLIVVIGWKHLLNQHPGPNPKLFTRLTVSVPFVNAGLLFSGTAFAAALVSLWPILTRPTRENAATRPVAIHLVVLFIVFLFTMAGATAIWFTTLRIRALFTPIWESQPLEIKLYIQDSLSCCGWFNATSAGLFNDDLRSGFCVDPDSIPRDPDPNVSIGCVGNFTNKADGIFNDTFTTLYGFTAIELGLFLAGACIANLRMQKKRFLGIDYKLTTGGKGGFV